MPEPIIGLPQDISRSDSRIMFLVGRNNDGQLALLNVDIAQDLVGAMNALASSLGRGAGPDVWDTETYSINGALFGVDFEGDINKITGAEYFNAGDSNIAVRLRFSATTGDESTGVLLLAPGRFEPVARHLGFEASTPDSGPSFLTVTRYANI